MHQEHYYCKPVHTHQCTRIRYNCKQIKTLSIPAGNTGGCCALHILLNLVSVRYYCQWGHPFSIPIRWLPLVYRTSDRFCSLVIASRVDNRSVCHTQNPPSTVDVRRISVQMVQRWWCYGIYPEFVMVRVPHYHGIGVHMVLERTRSWRVVSGRRVSNTWTVLDYGSSRRKGWTFSRIWSRPRCSLSHSLWSVNINSWYSG